MTADQTRWIARLMPALRGDIEDVLRLPFSLDVWQRQGTMLTVVATEATLAELERRHLAIVTRLRPVSEYQDSVIRRCNSTEPHVKGAENSPDKDPRDESHESDC
jgi:hypothetical protein